MFAAYARLALASLAFAFAVIGPTASAQAYVGPGLGLGTLAVVLGVIGSVLLAVFAVLWYPFKRMLKKMRGPATAEEKSSGK